MIKRLLDNQKRLIEEEHHEWRIRSRMIKIFESTKMYDEARELKLVEEMKEREYKRKLKSLVNAREILINRKRYVYQLHNHHEPVYTDEEGNQF